MGKKLEIVKNPKTVQNVDKVILSTFFFVEKIHEFSVSTQYWVEKPVIAKRFLPKKCPCGTIS